MRDVAVEELAEWSLADKTNAGGIFFLGVGQTDVICNPAHFGFMQLAHGKKGLAQLRLVHPVQKIALVFRGIQAFEQFVQAAGRVMADPRVMPSGDMVRAQAQSMV